MKTLNVQQVPYMVLDKISSLSALMQDVRAKYEIASNSVSEKKIGDVLARLAQECAQYATDLGKQVEQFGGSRSGFNNSKIDNDESCLQEFSSNGDIWTYCSQNEMTILKAYRHVLNDAHLTEQLRKLIRFQFNGLLFIFLQMKLLR